MKYVVINIILFYLLFIILFLPCIIMLFFSRSSSRNGREIEYLLASPQIQLSASGPGVDRSLQHTITLLFTHIKNYSAVGMLLLIHV